MLINPMSPLNSAAVGMKAGTPSHPLMSQAAVIGALHDLLVAVGWTASGVYASGNITYPLGFPVWSGAITTPKDPVACSGATLDTGAQVIIDGMPFRRYDPGTQAPVAGGPCKFFALGATEDVGLDNLSAAITLYSPRFNGSWARVSGIPVLTVTAKLPGPDANRAPILANTYSGVAGEVEGGGWIFTSVAQAQTAQYTVKVTTSGNFNAARVTIPMHFDLLTPYNSYGSIIITLDSAEGTDSVANDLGTAGYRIVANPYSFALYVPDPLTSRENAVFFCSPYIPVEDGFSACYALFVATAFSGGTTFLHGAVCLDGAPTTYIPGAYARVMGLRSPGTAALKTPSGAPLIIGSPYVMFARNNADTPAVVGRLWDCSLVHDLVTSGAVIDGKRYQAIGSQDGSAGRTRSTLLFRTEN